MREDQVLEKLKWTLQEILTGAEFNKGEDFLASTYWDEFEKQMQKWFFARARCREGEFEVAAEILEELNSAF